MAFLSHYGVGIPVVTKHQAETARYPIVGIKREIFPVRVDSRQIVVLASNVDAAPGQVYNPRPPGDGCCRMAPAQRESRRGMIEMAGGHLFPPVRRMATFAGFLEPSLVWIAVTRRTGSELQARKVSDVHRIFLVALPALDFLMQTGQMELRRVVVVL